MIVRKDPLVSVRNTVVAFGHDLVLSRLEFGFHPFPPPPQYRIGREQVRDVE